MIVRESDGTSVEKSGCSMKRVCGTDWMHAMMAMEFGVAVADMVVLLLLCARVGHDHVRAPLTLWT